ncbi:hypothetical protein NDU88_007734 [Pleurodeles waltl]|uniref:L1 transposable element RRM domain-containing protein n=1 Tax=Pleurodeles waltl TaxID=8319 RepID=A0AAV7QPZ3_PLEWA|nr:hypothetical protein NDU88_007734 [Pleurodeles waltl]
MLHRRGRHTEVERLSTVNNSPCCRLVEPPSPAEIHAWTGSGRTVAAEQHEGPDWVPVPRTAAEALSRFWTLRPAGMGKSDTKKPKLQFGATKLTRAPPEAIDNNDAQPAQGEHSEMGEMKALLLSMQSSLSSIDSKMDNMTASLDLLTNKLEKHVGCISETEQRISHVKDTMHAKSQQLLQMDKLLKIIVNKNEDLEGRSRRNNIRIVGVPESTDTGRMEQCEEHMLTTLFGEEAFSKMLVVERAHRGLTVKPPPWASPRPIIAYLQNYRDRDTTLRLGSERHPLQLDGNEISIYPNFTMAVLEARKKYTTVKQKMRQANVSYAMLFPARLKIAHKGKSLIFATLQQAKDYLKRNCG